MKPRENFVRVVDRKRYSVATATLLASDTYWDGHNFERSGRNMWLYRTPRGRYFTVTRTCWQGEQDSLTPCSEGEAIALYECGLSEHELEYSEAFPGVTVEEA